MYDWLFTPSIRDVAKALQRLIIWKQRRQSLTPASILSTIAILEVQLKDNANKLSDVDLRAMYSNAFVKSLNYMSSIVRGQQFTSMYATAKALGIESFLVDLRHLCAHGLVLPELEMSRRAATYCLEWLRSFYWDREKNIICNASVADVRLNSSLQLEEAVGELLFLYDAATKGIISGCKTVDDARENPDLLDGDSMDTLDQFAHQIRSDRLSHIADSTINRLSRLTNSTGRDRGNDNIYCDGLITQRHFLKTSSKLFYIDIEFEHFATYLSTFDILMIDSRR